jgi:hypothetical protein
MKYYYVYKTFILFLIFYTCNSHVNNSLLNKNICKQFNKTEYYLFNKNIEYYMCKNIVKKKNNPYVVLSKDILRKYVFIINVVLIYILLNSV